MRGEPLQSSAGCGRAIAGRLFQHSGPRHFQRQGIAPVHELKCPWNRPELLQQQPPQIEAGECVARKSSVNGAPAPRIRPGEAAWAGWNPARWKSGKTRAIRFSPKAGPLAESSHPAGQTSPVAPSSTLARPTSCGFLLSVRSRWHNRDGTGAFRRAWSEPLRQRSCGTNASPAFQPKPFLARRPSARRLNTARTKR